MAIKMVCALWIAGEKKEHHFFDLPQFGEPDFYRATGSYNAFHTREARSLNMWLRRKAGHPPRRGHVDDVDSMFSHIKLMPKSVRATMTQHPEFYHATIWDMYKAIGYDYQKKKYIV
jgi:hypothetical protein